MRSGAVLLAAGSSRRLKGSRPKQLMSFDGEPLFMKSLRVFNEVPSIREIVVVVSKECRSLIDRRIRSFSTKKKIRSVLGGAFRGESVRNGVRALSDQLDVVLVHDCARPLVTRDIVERVERAAGLRGVALAAWPVPDTLKLSTIDARVRKTISRQHMWLAQTPQGFKRAIAVQCLLKPSKTATDDVELAERKGYGVSLVRGSATNVKVTVPGDLLMCRTLVRRALVRVNEN